MRTSLILSCLVAVLSLSGCQKEQVKTAAAGPPVVPVSVGSVTEEAAPVELRVVGTVDASSVVQVKSQVAGQLERVAFTEGQNVNKGDLLFVIDPRPYPGGAPAGGGGGGARPGDDLAGGGGAGAGFGAGEVRRDGCGAIRGAVEGRAWCRSRSTTSRGPARMCRARRPGLRRPASRAPRRR